MNKTHFTVGRTRCRYDLWSHCGFGGTTTTVTIRVEGMHCGNCAASIAKKLKATASVQDFRVSFAKKEAWIKFDDQKITVDTLREVINSTGFKAVEEKPDSQ